MILSALETPPVIKIVRLQGLPPGGDIVDWLQSRQSNWDGYAPLNDVTGSLREELIKECKKNLVSDTGRMEFSGFDSWCFWLGKAQ